MSAKQIGAHFARGGVLPEIDNLAGFRAPLIQHLSRSLDMRMHTYTPSPSVAGSLDVATIIILLGDALMECDSDPFVQRQEGLQMWVARLFEIFEMRILAYNSYANQIGV